MSVVPFDDPISPNEIADHLRRMMELTGTNVIDLAHMNGLTPQAVDNWLRARNLTKVACVLAVFESMGCVVKIIPPKHTQSRRARPSG